MGIVQHATVIVAAIFANIYKTETVPCIAYCKKNHAEESHIIMPKRSWESRLKRCNMLPINSPDTMQHLPKFKEVIRNFLPVTFCRQGLYKIFQDIPEFFAYFINNRTDRRSSQFEFKCDYCFVFPVARKRNVTERRSSGGIGSRIWCFLVILFLSKSDK